MTKCHISGLIFNNNSISKESCLFLCRIVYNLLLSILKGLLQCLLINLYKIYSVYHELVHQTRQILVNI